MFDYFYLCISDIASIILIIDCSNYTEQVVLIKQKLDESRYFIETNCIQVQEKSQVQVSSTTMEYIINHTDTEQGVRNLKRCLNIFYFICR